MKHLIIFLSAIILPFLTLPVRSETAEETFQKGFAHYLYEQYAEAAKCFETAANQGYANAQFFLGVVYASGEGVVKDSKKAFVWVEKAANQKHSRAQLVVGTMYEKGEGVAKDFEKAKFWYQKAADQEEEGAQEALDSLKIKMQKP